eukprot:TRINITY_DN402_c0_g2_i1.p1 TRINITY_DN402_c0_g2~~TRINITY_DN402_c0_g2_i1.p1  ORF type:complete len:109 (-),score=21.00 TRINITY_DN402_c0_g2_i1:129-416(-)
MSYPYYGGGGGGSGMYGGGFSGRGGGQAPPSFVWDGSMTHGTRAERGLAAELREQYVWSRLEYKTLSEIVHEKHSKPTSFTFPDPSGHKKKNGWN